MAFWIDFMKYLPGIRPLVEGRDRFIQLYTEQVNLNHALKDKLESVERLNKDMQEKSECLERSIQEIQQKNTALEAVQYELCAEKKQMENTTQRILLELECARKERAEETQALEKTVAQLQIQCRDLDTELEQQNQKCKEQLDRENQLTEQLKQYDYRKNTETLASSSFWNNHYAHNGTSGTGSYNRLAEFKSQVVNAFLMQKKIHTTIELGCGDGNQLALIHYESYVGVDVSPIIVERDRNTFAEDKSKTFYCSLTEREQYARQTYDLAISMDVIFHLLEEPVFHAYLNDLFTLSDKFVIIYSSNHEEFTPWPEYRHRNFTGYVQTNFPEWELVRYIPNQYCYQIGQEEKTSASDFYIYQKQNH